MRTTLTLDDDVLDRARALSEKLRAPFRSVVNDALRKGMEAIEKPAKMKRYRTVPRKMGLKAGKNLDNIYDLIAQVEVESFR